MESSNRTPFNANALAYSPNNAYWLAQASQIAYQNEATIKAAISNLGMEHFRFLSRNDTEGFVAGNEEVIVVAFRGTEPTHLQDLLSDAKIRRVRGPFGNVHRGFLGAFNQVVDDMFTAIDAIQDKSRPQSVWFTGHSLGAALASIAASHFLADSRTLGGVYNFGQPRVGDDEYAGEFDKRIEGKHFRFVNNNDTVTRVPPRQLGYQHTGSLRYIDMTGTIHDDSSMWSRFLDRVKGRADDFLKPGTDGLKDHSMGLYLAYIGNALLSARHTSDKQTDIA